MSINKEKKTELIEQYSRSKTDTGSPEVQIAILTQRIENLSQKIHCATSFARCRDFSK